MGGRGGAEECGASIRPFCPVAVFTPAMGYLDQKFLNSPVNRSQAAYWRSVKSGEPYDGELKLYGE